jgi:hypothetical protein
MKNRAKRRVNVKRIERKTVINHWKNSFSAQSDRRAEETIVFFETIYNAHVENICVKIIFLCVLNEKKGGRFIFVDRRKKNIEKHIKQMNIKKEREREGELVGEGL